MERTSKIKNFEEYLVSDAGNVYSRKGRVKKLKPIFNKNGYVYVSLSKKGRVAIKTIHRLVAESFLPNPENKRTVNHKNGNKKDNRVENLEWNTYSENLCHRYRILKQLPVGKNKTGKSCKNSKIVLQFRDGIFLNKFYGAHEAQRTTGISFQKICMCCRGERKHAGGFEWKYE